MKVGKVMLLIFGVSFLVIFFITENRSEIDLESWYQIELNRSSSGIELERRQWFTTILLQQSGILLTLFIISLGFPLFHNYRVYGNLTKRLTNAFKAKEYKQKNWSDRLSNRFPNLTLYEMVLCEMLYQGLSSKQIASKLNISPLSVNTARYRLRKKLKVSPNTELIYFLRKL